MTLTVVTAAIRITEAPVVAVAAEGVETSS